MPPTDGKPAVPAGHLIWACRRPVAIPAEGLRALLQPQPRVLFLWRDADGNLVSDPRGGCQMWEPRPRRFRFYVPSV